MLCLPEIPRDAGTESLLAKALRRRSSASLAEWALLVECASPAHEIPSLGELLQHPLNWDKLLHLADEHGMLPLLTARLRDQSLVPREIQRKLQEWHRTQTIVTLGMTAELFRLLECLRAARVDALVIKGPALAQRCYGDPAMRQYDDLDLIVRQKDIQRATEVMIQDLGYEPRIPLKAIAANKIPGEYIFRARQTKLLVEFHTEHTFRYHPRRLQIDRLFERQVRIEFDGHDVPALSAEDELTLICIHGAKHFWERLMWIADVAGLASGEPGVDPRRALKSAREVGAQRMLRVGLALASMVPRTQLPPELDADLHSDPAVLQVAAKICDRLSSPESSSLGIFERAAFRTKMRGGFLQSAAYLMRLSLSPTEEDWGKAPEAKRLWLLDALGRPFRLARKYNRDQRS